MRLFTRVGQALVVAGALGGGPAMANSKTNPIAYTSPEFKKAFDCYTATIQGNVTRQDEANFALTSLPYFDSDRDGQLTPKEIDGIRNPRVHGMIVNLAENLETCGSVKTSEKPVLNPSAEPVQIKRPEDTMAAERSHNRSMVLQMLLIAGPLGLLIGALAVFLVMRSRITPPRVSKRFQTRMKKMASAERKEKKIDNKLAKAEKVQKRLQAKIETTKSRIDDLNNLKNE